MEKVARAQYLANKDAKESALLYIALERRTVLAGLLKISKDERDRPLVDFLARDFQVRIASNNLFSHGKYFLMHVAH